MTDSRWHILRVRSGFEKQVASASGFPCYVPQVLHSYFNRRLRKNIQYYTPMFAGFVFVKLATPAEFVVAPNANIFGFMRNGDRTPAVLSTRAFDALRNTEILMAQAALCPSAPVENVLHIGQSVGVKIAGSHDTFMALIKEIRDDKVLTELVGSQMRIEVGRSALVA